jgi:hypothetical protein
MDGSAITEPEKENPKEVIGATTSRAVSTRL